MTTEERVNLRALCNKATPGYWVYMGDAEPWAGEVVAIGDDSAITTICSTPVADDRLDDMVFIAAARMALPELLDALDAAEAKVARLEAFAAEVRIAQRADADGLDECAWNWIDAALAVLDAGEVKNASTT